MDNQEKPKEQEEIREPKEVLITDIELENLRKESEEFRHKYLHILADLENARKRLQKDRDDIVQYAIRTIILDFLTPIDHLESALKYTDDASSEVKHWATGFRMILNQFKEVLTNNGVTSIESAGKPFDPHLHHAVEMVETSEHPPGIVIQENMRGYIMNEKTLRPARVTVSKTPAEKSGNEAGKV